ncbi:MAG: carbohydrate-binding protein [Lentisphaeraceae bacterium]|nr:carbohydrate-binding protein [Lentisphaeraceae bacterium]
MRNPVTGGSHNLEIDCYNDELRIGVEYQGRQHYSFNPRFHKNKEAFRNQQYRDYQLLMTPKVSLQRSNQFLEAAYKSEPQNGYIIMSLAANYFISMDFARLHHFYQRHPQHLVFFKPFMRTFLNKNEENKSFREFESMLKFAARIPVLMELVVAYNTERLGDHRKFPMIISSLISTYYPESAGLELSLKEKSLEMWAPKLRHMTSPTTKLSLLRYLNFKNLFIADNSITSATEFAGLNLRKLYLQHTGISDLTPLLKLPGLDHVTVQDGQIPEKQLAEFSKHFTKDLMQVYEAESANLSGGAYVDYDHKNYTSDGFVAGLYKNSRAVISFTLTAVKSAKENVSLRYSAGHGDAEVIVTLNGVISELKLNSTGTWEQWQEIEIPLQLSKGKNTLNIQMKDKTRNCFNLDYIFRRIKY